jgi:hypothetical protein
MLDFKNSIWQLILSRTISYVMSTVDLKVNRSQYKHVLHKNCIKIVQLNVYKSQGLKWVYLFNKIQQKNVSEGVGERVHFTEGKCILMSEIQSRQV